MVETLVLGEIQENCYLIHSDDSCIVVDPGNEEALSYILEHGYKVSAIFITHAHFDHIGGVDAIYNYFKCPIYAHKDSELLLTNTMLNLSAFRTPISISSPVTYFDTAIQVGHETVRMYATPGHCQGACCYYFEKENVLMSGDTLFRGSVGRFDFPTSSSEQTMHSIELLKSLDLTCPIYPGHGDITTLEFEKMYNPYFR